jgi:hypothetical protein
MTMSESTFGTSGTSSWGGTALRAMWLCKSTSGSVARKGRAPTSIS